MFGSKSKDTAAKPDNRRRTVLLALVVVSLLAFALFRQPKEEVALPPVSRPAARKPKKPVAPVEAPASAPVAPQAPSAPAEPAPAANPTAVAVNTPPPVAAEEPARELPQAYTAPGEPKPGSLQSPMEALREPGPEPPAPVPTAIVSKIRRYAESIVARYDADGDRRLSAAEWRQMPGDPSVADLNGDGQLESQEIAARVAVYSRRRMIRLMPSQVEPATAEPAMAQTPAASPQDSEPSAAEVELARRARQFYVPDGTLPSGLPKWFVASDANGDAQVSMAEFSAQWSGVELDRFKHYDTDGDGLITVNESLAAGSGDTPTAAQPPATDSAATP